jgi:predicted MFS family arabinose efflux permease
MAADKVPQLPAAFQRLAWSNLVAQSADQIALAAAPIVAVFSLGVAEGKAGLLQTALTLPFVLFAIPAGLMSDRMSRPLLMAGAEALRAIALLATLLLLWAGLLNLGLLALLGAIAVCGTVVYSVAAPSLVPSLVSQDRLSTANARIELARTVAFAGGPALGGLLVGWVGAAAAFALAALLSIAATGLLGGIKEQPRTLPPRRAPLREIRAGAAFVFEHTMLRPIFITQFIFNVGSFTILSVFVPYAVRHLGQSPSSVGVILGMYGGGMVIGALGAARVLRMIPFGVVVGIGPIAGFLASVLMVLTIYLPSPVIAAASFFLLGAGPILWVISTTTLRQAVTPPSLLGRVSAINIVAYGARPIGAGIGAVVGAAYGAEACLCVAALLFFAQMAVIWLSPAVGLARQPEMVREVATPAGQRA